MKKKNSSQNTVYPIPNTLIIDFIKEENIATYGLLYKYYYFLIEKIVELYINDELKIDFTLNVLHIGLYQRKEEIKTIDDIRIILFEETWKRCAIHCPKNQLSELKEKLNQLEEIFKQVELLPDEPHRYQTIVKLRLWCVPSKKMAEILNVPLEEVAILSEFAAEALIKALAANNQTEAILLFDEVVYNYRFFI